MGEVTRSIILGFGIFFVIGGIGYVIVYESFGPLIFGLAMVAYAVHRKVADRKPRRG